MEGIATTISLVDQMTAPIMAINNAINNLVTGFANVESASSIDSSSLDSMIQQVQMANMAAEMLNNTYGFVGDALANMPDIVPVKIEWQSPDRLEVFDSTGFARYQQEIQSANAHMNRVIATQQKITQQAQSMELLPPNAVSDIVGIHSRVAQLHQQFQRLEENALSNIGAEQASAQVEQLRQRLSQTYQVQNDLNSALERMDVSAANAAYNRLNSLVNETSRGIRDSEAAQHNFNNAINQGSSSMDGLAGKIGRVVAAYASIQGVGKVLGISDEMTQITARINLMNDGLQTTQELQNKIFSIAQNTGSSYLDTANMITKLGLQAGNAFSSNDEVIAFADLLNKTFVTAGTSAQGVESTMYNLTQALSSGVLRGQDLNAVLSNTPQIAGYIADYLGVGVDKVKELASQSAITADVVSGAMFAAGDEINALYEQMPSTFSRIANQIKDQALMAFQPVLNRLNEIANSPAFQTLVSNVINVISIVASVVMEIFNTIAGISQFAADNWYWLEPIIGTVVAAMTAYVAILAVYNTIQAISNGLTALAAFQAGVKAAADMLQAGATFAATVAQHGLNAALLACPLTWIIIAIIAVIGVIYLAIAVINKFAGTSISATGIIAGVFGVLATAIYDVVAFLWNIFAGVAEFFVNVWNEPMYSVKKFFGDLIKNVLNMLKSFTSGWDDAATNMANAMIDGINTVIRGLNWLIEKINSIPWLNTNIKTLSEFNHITSITSALDDASDKIDKWIGEKPEDYWTAPKMEMKTFESGWTEGYEWGKNLENSIGDFLNPPLDGMFSETPYTFENPALSGIAGGVGNIDANTGKQLDFSEEELKLWRDIAERESVDYFTTAEVSISFGDINNNVSSDMDLDGIVDYIGEHVEERMLIIAEGVHV